MRSAAPVALFLALRVSSPEAADLGFKGKRHDPRGGEFMQFLELRPQEKIS
jgi:hypothetical protein